MRRYKALISFILVVAIYAGTLAPFGLPTTPEVNAQKVGGKTRQTNMNLTPGSGLKFRLSEGAEGAEQRTTTPPTKGDALSESETSNLLKRLPPVKAELDDQTDFAKRQGSLP